VCILGVIDRIGRLLDLEVDVVLEHKDSSVVLESVFITGVPVK